MLQLWSRLGDLAPLVERWDLDVCALGRRDANGERLAFVARSSGVTNRFDVSLEPGTFRVTGLRFEDLLEVIRAHLSDPAAG